MGKARIAIWVLLALLLAGAVTAKSFFSFYVIPQNGMYPTLPAGSRLLARKHAYRSAADIKRGDVILFNRSDEGRKFLFIWRVIALPGDTIAISNANVFVNDALLTREELRRAGDFVIYREHNGDAIYEVAYDQSPDVEPRTVAPVKLGADEIFVLGDNRYNAQDSTYSGPVRFGDIIGRKR